MKKSLRQRFEEKFNVTPGCWAWTASRSKSRYLEYGQFNDGTGMRGAHRVSYKLYVGQIPAGLQVLHRCDNPVCVNPDHLFLGTNDDNVKDKVAKGRASKMPGDLHPRRKLSSADIIAIRADTRIQKAIAADYGVGQTHISAIKSGARWSHLA